MSRRPSGLSALTPDSALGGVTKCRRLPTYRSCKKGPCHRDVRVQNGELLDSHMFFFDRYSDLADYHRMKGRTAKAERLAAIAEAHYRAAPDDDDPDAAAMAMPVPRPPLKTNAVSTTRMNKPPVERRSPLMHSPAP